MLHKADILPAFPAYAPILSPPIPQDLPWLGSASGWTVGESRETELTTTSRGGGGRRGKVTLRAIRKGSAFGPGDEVQLFVEIVSTCQTTIRVSSFLSTHTHTQRTRFKQKIESVARSTRVCLEGTNHVQVPFPEQLELPRPIATSDQLDRHVRCQHPDPQSRGRLAQGRTRHVQSRGDRADFACARDGQDGETH